MGLSFRKHLGSSAGFNSGGLSNRGGYVWQGLSSALHQWSWQQVSIVGTTMTATDFGSIGGLDLSNPDEASLPSIDNVTKCLTFASGQYLKRAVTNFRKTDSAGVIHAWVKVDETSFAQYFSSSTEGNANQFAALNASSFAQQFFLNQGASNILRENDGYTGWHVLSIVQDGTVGGKLLIDGGEVLSYSQTSLGFRWLDDITSNTIAWNALIRTTVSAPSGKSRYIAYCPYVDDLTATNEVLEILQSPLLTPTP